jgi:Rrf2 family protein
LCESLAIINGPPAARFKENPTMLLTRASEYALLSLIVIAKADKPLDAESLATELDISKSFLAKILQAMARQDILNSFKGVNGGFALAMKPEEITIHAIMCAAEGKTPAVFDCSGSQSNCPSDRASTCGIWPFLNRLQGKIDNFLDNLTLADIMEE